MAGACRVLILSQYYHPEVTGSAPVVTNVAEWLAQAGHEVMVLTTRPHYPRMEVSAEYADGARDREVVNGVTVHRVPPVLGKNRGLVQRARAEVSYMAAMLRRVVSLRSLAPDVVISLCPSMLTVVGAAIGPALGRRHLVLLHDIQSGLAASLGMGTGSVMCWAMQTVERFALNRADAVVVLSDSMERVVRGLGVSAHVAVLPPQVDIDRVTPIPERPEWSRTVLYSGNLGQKQGMGQVLDMAAVLQAERSDIQVVIRGDGNQRRALEQRTHDDRLTNLRFEDLRPSSELAEAFGSCAVHLVPQRPGTGDFSVPSKLYTIMAAGRPAVCTAASGSALHRLMRDSGAIVCVPPGSPAALAEAITALLADPARRRELGRAGRAYVEAHLARQNVVAAFEDLFGPRHLAPTAGAVGGRVRPAGGQHACADVDRELASRRPVGYWPLRRVKKYARQLGEAMGPRAVPGEEQ